MTTTHDSSLTREALYIGGKWVAPSSSAQIAITDATTEEQLGLVPDANEDDVDAAVAAARRAFDRSGWADLSGENRSAAIHRFVDAMERRSSDIARLVSQQNGMPITLSEQFEGVYAAMIVRYYADLAKTPTEERRPSPLGFDTVIQKAPVGVVAAIVPWNYPQVLAATKIGAALAAGCTVVVKPSPGTALDSFLLAEAAEEAELPAGVLNWVPGGRELGAYLVSHPDVDKVAFTGSTAAGRSIAEVCGRLLRPVSLELGGKSAAIILEDAELEATLQGLFFASFANNGQTCVNCSRILVPASRYDEIAGAIADFAGSLKVGDPLDAETQVGPLASDAQRQRVERYLDLGRREGRLLTGGSRPAGLDTGFFVQPTVFGEVDNSAVIAQEEIFGPVVALIKYSDEDQAVSIANDSSYGLGGTVWSADQAHGVDIARRVQSGSFGVNGFVFALNAPFGGVKDSGLGREFGPEGMQAYQTVKSIYLP